MKKILIISSNRLGDSILSSGLHNFFKNSFKSVELTLVCGETPSQLFKYCGNIDNLIVLKKKKYSLHWLKLWKILFLTKWYLIVDLRGSAISYFLLSNTRLIYRKKKKEIKEHKVISITRGLIKKVAEPEIKLKSNIKFNDTNLKKVQSLKKKYNLVMIAPTANWIGKIWPVERYFDLIVDLKKKSIFKKTIFIFVGPSSEAKWVGKIINSRKSYIYNLFGNSSLIEIFHIMKECMLFIGNDSGLMHMASLAKVKTIGLFGPSDKVIYGPWGKGNLTISSPKSPDDLMGYKGFSSKDCGSLMIDLETNEVLKRITNFFKN